MVAEADVPAPEGRVGPVYGELTGTPLFATPLSAAMERIERGIGDVLFEADGTPRTTLFDAREPERTRFEARAIKAPPREIARYDFAGKKVLVASTSAAAATVVRQQAANVMPPDVLAAMRLCEYYWATEGDVRMTIEIPMDLALRPVKVEDKDPGIQKELLKLLGPFYLDIDRVIEDIWITMELYGSGYPFEVWDQRIPDDLTTNQMARGLSDPIVAAPQQITCLNPKFLYVGVLPFGGGYSMALSPWGEDGRSFRDQLLSQNVPPMTYNALAYDIHETLVWAWNVELAPGVCTQIRDKAPSFVRYPWPSLMSTFRTLSTRQILEEMIRATIEGTKNQLWAFLLGDPAGNNRPTADEIKALSATVGGMAGTRTGSLVWGGHLRIEVHAPKVEDALANTKLLHLTEHFFRQRGISLHIVSGEGSSTGGGGMDPADGLDVKVFIERMNFKRNQINRWLAKFVRKVMLFSGSPTMIARVRNDDLPSVTMGDFGIEQEADVKNRILPYHSSGLLSPQTTLKHGGFNYDHEIALHKAADKEELAPPASFAQAVVNAQGESTTHAQTGKNGAHGDNKRTSTPRGRRTGTGGERGKDQ